MNRFTRLIFTLFIAASIAIPASLLADDHAGVQTADSQSALTPGDALNLLKEGNERFLSGEMINRDLPAQVEATASGQFPHSVVLSCIDSRVPPELVFDQGLGDIFSPRVAGNFVDEELLGSMEFAAAVAGSKVIVVLGHTECGAVKGACDDVKLGNLTATLANIRPAVEAVSGIPGERNSKNKAFVDAVAHQNVKMTVDNILDRSLVLRELVDKGRLMVVGAMYDVATGKVTFMD
ncbi:MAG: carbonic anhydrase family protein [Xanthomonadales bacterium]|jgi:carbonic anhydrase|nr:carbonic anhydrase family protein [Xanthomonadales bacterium]